jgi:hypothetical protein
VAALAPAPADTTLFFTDDDVLLAAAVVDVEVSNFLFLVLPEALGIELGLGVVLLLELALLLGV